MAGLADFDFTVSTHAVKLPGGNSFTVRGISLIDIAAILREHTDQIERWYLDFKEREENATSGDPKYAAAAASQGNFAKSLLEGSPALAADIIAYASDEPEHAHKVAKLPFPAQLEALENIAKLTFTEDDGIKKAIDTVMRMVSGITSSVTHLTAQQTTLLESASK